MRVAIELIDELAAGTRTRLDIDTLTANVSASPDGVRNALECLCAAGYLIPSGGRRGLRRRHTGENAWRASDRSECR